MGYVVLVLLSNMREAHTVWVWVAERSLCPRPLLEIRGKRRRVQIVLSSFDRPAMHLCIPTLETQNQNPTPVWSSNMDRPTFPWNEHEIKIQEKAWRVWRRLGRVWMSLTAMLCATLDFPWKWNSFPSAQSIFRWMRKSSLGNSMGHTMETKLPSVFVYPENICSSLHPGGGSWFSCCENIHNFFKPEDKWFGVCLGSWTLKSLITSCPRSFQHRISCSA